MMTYTEAVNRLHWQRDQLSRYATVFVYDDYQRTRAVDRLDVTNEALHSKRRSFIVVASMRNDDVLEQMRAAIIAMPDDQWAEIAADL